MRRTFGILGWPVKHSRSPAMHEAAFRELGIDAVYVPFGVRPERLGAAVEGLRALGIDGVNVTLPHKAAVLPLLDRVEPVARAIGAVNTIVRDGDVLVGTNTDAPGFVRALREAGFDPAGRRTVLVGAGGAARAVVVGLAEAGAAAVAIAARRPERARALAEELAKTAGGTVLEGLDLGEALRERCGAADLLVQATSATLEGSADAEAFASSLPLDALPPGATVTDLVYTPRQTTVLEAAGRRGLRTIDGLGMLLFQGVLAFERWTGRAAPVAVMRATLE